MSALSEDELRRMWREAGGILWLADGSEIIDEPKLLPFLRSLTARAAAEERERCVRIVEVFVPRLGRVLRDLDQEASEVESFLDDSDAAVEVLASDLGTGGR